MHKWIRYCLLFLFFQPILAFGQKSTYDFNASCFYSPKDGFFIETYLQINLDSLFTKDKDSLFYRETVENILLRSFQDSIERRFTIRSESPLSKRSLFRQFYDIQRIAVDTGKYTIKSTIWDKAGISDTCTFIHSLEAYLPPDSVFLSDITLISHTEPSSANSKFTRNGMKYIPKPSLHYPEQNNALRFYIEFYDLADKYNDGLEILAKTQLRIAQTGFVLPGFSSFARFYPDSIAAIQTSFNISNLPTGKYILDFEIRDRENQLLARKSKHFTRRKPGAYFHFEDIPGIDISNTFIDSIISKDTIINYIDMIWPVLTGSDRKFLGNDFKNRELLLLKQFLYNYWFYINNDYPYEEWLAYRNRVKEANRLFREFQKGYATERGRIYLQYGPPDYRYQSRHEPIAYPYEIWHYYHGKRQMHLKFVFYDPGSTGHNFNLLHSTARGEIFNSNWLNVLTKNRGASHYGTHIMDEYNKF